MEQTTMKKKVGALTFKRTFNNCNATITLTDKQNAWKCSWNLVDPFFAVVNEILENGSEQYIHAFAMSLYTLSHIVPDHTFFSTFADLTTETFKRVSEATKNPDTTPEDDETALNTLKKEMEEVQNLDKSLNQQE